ncbi:MAG: hypothetical protein JSR41_05840 [Proteobacteria bacterium]|nr:hypothetical protein [Pseudomonadota bacterium]
MKKSVRINATLLSPALRARFDTMLQVAGRRSIVQWLVAEDPSAADVVLKQAPGNAGDERTVPIYVGDTLPPGDDPQRLCMPADFRVSTLMDALDLAAVRVMNRWDALARATPLVTRPEHDAPAQQYQLRHWVFLGDNRSGMAYTRTLAAMTQRPVTRQWMTSRGGLSAVQADSLLADLQLRGALRTTILAPLAEARGAATPARAGFVGRLKRWLAGSRPQALTSAG